jgi:outer membrane murein-binding lipoprotein Lpp
MKTIVMIVSAVVVLLLVAGCSTKQIATGDVQQDISASDDGLVADMESLEEDFAKTQQSPLDDVERDMEQLDW